VTYQQPIREVAVSGTFPGLHAISTSLYGERMPKKPLRWEVIWESEPDVDAEENLLRALQLLLPPPKPRALDEPPTLPDKQDGF
jgi:hypothetical protein